MQSIVIGICGGTGSGKTTLASRIKSAFGQDAVMLSMDSYYKSNRDIPFEERVKINYDHPDSFDTDLLVEHMRKLKNGETIYHPVYDFTQYMRTDEVKETKSAKVIILEGLLNFYNADLLKLQDIKIYRRRRTHTSQNHARRKRAGKKPRIRRQSISDDRRTYVRAFYRTNQTPCRYHSSRGRLQRGCLRNDSQCDIAQNQQLKVQIRRYKHLVPSNYTRIIKEKTTTLFCKTSGRNDCFCKKYK